MHFVVKEGRGVGGGRLRLTRAPESCRCAGVGAVGRGGGGSRSVDVNTVF